MSMGERIRARRLELGLTLEDIGKALGVNRSTIKRYEDGKTQRIGQDTMEMLAVILKTTPGYLMGWDTPAAQGKEKLDGEILILAREMQRLPEDKRNLLKTIVKAMSDIADKEMNQ
jgi:HTH-type transcriptional regulator, cell division transcriptional repressor